MDNVQVEAAWEHHLKSCSGWREANNPRVAFKAGYEAGAASLLAALEQAAAQIHCEWAIPCGSEHAVGPTCAACVAVEVAREAIRVAKSGERPQ